MEFYNPRIKPKEFEKLIKENTSLVYLESPGSLTFELQDFPKLCQITNRLNIKSIADNTWGTILGQNPLNLGVDAVIESYTKYVSGHSDVILGALIVNDSSLSEQLAFIQNASGAVPGPMDSYLTLRGIKTLHVRMQRHCENAKAIAKFLSSHSEIKKVYWPGFKSHPNHEIAKAQMKDFGAMISFIPKDSSYKTALKIIKKLKIFTLAESLGGVESLVGHPASMTHASIPKKEREIVGVIDSLVRFSVGIEDIDDLIEDIDHALK